MIEKYGDLFDSDAYYLGHGVNTCGLMGAGIAKTFRDKFPLNYVNYVDACKEDRLRPGGFLAHSENFNGDPRVIVNFATQYRPGPRAQYDWLFDSIRAWADAASVPRRLTRFGGCIAIPEIGCGIGGLEWPIVQMHLEVIESMYSDIEFEVWHYDS